MRQVYDPDRQALRCRDHARAAAKQRIVDLTHDLALQSQIAGDYKQRRSEALLFKKFLFDPVISVTDAIDGG